MDLFKDNESGSDKYMENNDLRFGTTMKLDRELGFTLTPIGLSIPPKPPIFDIICKGTISWTL